MSLQFFKIYKVPLIVFILLGCGVASYFIFQNSGEDFYQKGLAAMNQGAVDQAIDCFGKAIRRNPSDPAARFGLGWAYHKKGWLDEASKQYAQSQKTSLEILEYLWYNLGLLESQKGDSAKALQFYQKALLLQPHSKNILIQIIEILKKTGAKPEVLMGYLQQLRKVDSQNAQWAFLLGQVFEKLGRKKEALSEYESASFLKPSFSEALQKKEQLMKNKK